MRSNKNRKLLLHNSRYLPFIFVFRKVTPRWFPFVLSGILIELESLDLLSSSPREWVKHCRNLSRNLYQILRWRAKLSLKKIAVTRFSSEIVYFDFFVYIQISKPNLETLQRNTWKFTFWPNLYISKPKIGWKLCQIKF